MGPHGFSWAHKAPVLNYPLAAAHLKPLDKQNLYVIIVLLCMGLALRRFAEASEMSVSI